MTEIVIIGCGHITSITCLLALPYLEIEKLHLVDERGGYAQRLKRDLEQMDLDVEISAYDGISGVPPNVTLAIYSLPALVCDNICALPSFTKKYIPYARTFSGVWVTASDPVDTLNWFFSNYIPHEKCIGFGNQIDSARVDAMVRRVDPNFMAVAFGEHGKNVVPIIRDGKLDPNKDSMCPRSDEWRTLLCDMFNAKDDMYSNSPAFHLCNLIASVVQEEDYARWHPTSVITHGAFLQESYGFGEGVGGISIGLSTHVNAEGVSEYDAPPMDAWEKNRMKTAMEVIDARNKSILKDVE